MFRIHESWEIPIPPIFSDDGSKTFKCVEIVLNTYLFMVEFTVDYGENGGKMTKIMLLDSIQEAISVIGKFEDLNINLYAPRYENKNNEMSISTIEEVIECKDIYEQTAYLFKCKNGETYIHSMTDRKENQLKDKKTIYCKSN